MISKNLIHVTKSDDLKTVLACFKVNKISHIPVIENSRIVGMISKTDVVESLYDNFEDLSQESFDSICHNTFVRELMIQPVIVAQVKETEMQILNKLISHEVGSIIIKDGDEVVGIVTEKDLVKYLCQITENTMSFSDKLGNQLVQWMEKNGLFKISKALSDIGI